MTATIFLVRHAAHGHIGKTLSGRQPDLALSDEGREQAAKLGRALWAHKFARLQSSPVLRAQQTAQAICDAADRPCVIETVPALEEIDFGDWTGRDFAALDMDPQWQQWNAHRSRARAPGGETMIEAQARAVAHIEAAAVAHPGAEIAMVSHCDIIRAAIAHYLGLVLDNILRFDIDPASISRLAVGSWGGRVLTVNEVVG